MRCNCGNEFFDFVLRRNNTYNTRPYRECKVCGMASNRSSQQAPRTGRLAAAELSDTDGDLADQPAAAIIGSCCSARLAGAELGPGSHPRMDVGFRFSTVDGPRDVQVAGAVADSGAQVCILPSHLVSQLPAIPNSDNSHLAHLKGADN